MSGTRSGSLAGRLAEIMLWNRVLGPAEVSVAFTGFNNIWASVPQSTAGGLIALYALEEGEGGRLEDNLGVNADAHTIGDPAWVADV
eukprot:CAMPEP_0114263584 /NCGR_PEP_ID=MMETSP0058-20121206/22621_1 /TAXON_ID=36894 /ORGANISM="Pyramimonas parkeae, CCMP726" /LENGTH=86 /DNA_ID=CAMNT_0001379941 /DNA_START=21 /DNA_END=278 /DNA_ORIENTATION=+